MTNTTEKSLRDKYFANEIFRIGELVEDVSTGEQMQILDRGTNYVTVATSAGIVKKWLNQVTEELTPKESVSVITESVKELDVELLESGQIKLFGFETRNFDKQLSELMISQFGEFDDLYSKHQIVKCLDMALDESNLDTAYNLCIRVEGFYDKQNMRAPFIVEGLKTDIERTRIAGILASVAQVEPSKSNYKTIIDTIDALKKKYKQRVQWEVLWPFFKIAQDAGLMGIEAKLPFKFDTDTNESTLEDDITVEVLEENVEEFAAELNFDDIYDTFSGDELSEQLISEVLSIEDRALLARKLRQRAPAVEVKRERALSHSASTDILLSRARKLAETMLKRKMFHKAPADMNRQDKERFEAGAGRRRALVARLAQRLVGKVRQLQTARLHHEETPVSSRQQSGPVNKIKVVPTGSAS
jgi:hypothetical protein